MRIVLTGGGTGGHIYPALTLWQHMKRKHPALEVLYIGTEQGLERNIVERAEVPFTVVKAAPLRRKLSLSAVRTAIVTYQGYREAKKILKEFRPDVVVGTGGFVTLPVVFAASQLEIPSVVWEANARPGLTNQLCARKASAIAISFPDSERYFSGAKRVVLTGNPRGSEAVLVTPDQMSAARSEYGIDPKCQLILFFAGSRGSETVNEVMVSLLPRLAEKPRWQLLYATGEAHYATVRERIGCCPPNVTVLPFIHNIPSVMPQADVVITRAGGATLSEICTYGVPSILIPSPYVTANHQEANARHLADAGAAMLLRESDLTVQSLWNALEQVLEKGRGAVLREGAKRMATPDAVDRLYEVVVQVMKH